MKPLRAGQLRRSVAIQATTDTRNSVGEPVESWATITGGTVWASLEPLTGREYQTAGVIAAEASHMVRIRYLANITPKHRVLFGSRVFDILGVRNIEERQRMTELFVRERV
jgi:SPP1 family predicted phage head-tail adaptor